MLRSSYCSLFDHSDKELTDLGECPYDQVRLSKIGSSLLPSAARAAAASTAWANRGQQGHACTFPKPLWLRLLTMSRGTERVCRASATMIGPFSICWCVPVPEAVHSKSQSVSADICSGINKLKWGLCASCCAQGGYFVVNGSEKVLIAQERMANNHVYVFRYVSL